MRSSTERNLGLRGHSISSAAARLTELAAEMDYGAVPTAPRTYQLVRKRRRLLTKQIETMTVSLLEDRAGTRARATGDIDDLFLQRLGGIDVEDEIDERSGPRPVPIPADQHTPEQRGREQGIELHRSAEVPPPVQQRSRAGSRPGASPSGMISEVPGASKRGVDRSTQPEPPVAPVAAKQVLPPPAATRAPSPAPASDIEEHTVLRKRVDPQPMVSSGPVLHGPNGVSALLDVVAVIGRNPDPTRVAGSAPVVIDDRSISKTHAVVEVLDGRLIVTDLYSTNGTWIEVGDQTLGCEPGTHVEIPLETCRLRFGDARVDVRVSS